MNNSYNSEEQWKQLQQQANERANRLANLLTVGEKLHLQIDPVLFQKLDTLKKEISAANRKLCIALLGGFSEGKTSLAAAWLDRLDKTSMKINAAESSDTVEVYETEFCKIVDTPGLFGFKEKENGERYKDITRKYISQADLVLYLMDSVNPMKEGHIKILQWLFDTLDLLPRTVFVLSSFDKVADLDDEEEYARCLEIKKQNVLKRLQEDVLPPERHQQLLEVPIVAVSANPGEKGFEYWQQHKEDFYRISHVPQLQQSTQELIEKTGPQAIILQTQNSILKDITSNILPRAEVTFNDMKFQSNKMNEAYRQIAAQKKQFEASMVASQTNLMNRISDYYTDLILQVQGLSLETYEEFFQREIGSEGIIINTKIQTIFAEVVQSSNVELRELESRYLEESHHFAELINQWGKPALAQAGKWLSGINNQTILTARNWLAPGLKFKPWGATNLATKIGKFGGTILILLQFAADVAQEVNEYKQKKKFEKVIQNTKTELETQRKDLLASISNKEEFIKTCFPSLLELNKQLQEAQQLVVNLDKQCNDFLVWKDNCYQLQHEIKAQLPMK